MSLRERLEATFPLTVSGQSITLTHVSAVLIVVGLLTGGLVGFMAAGGPIPSMGGYEHPNGTNATTITNTTMLMGAHDATLATEGYTLLSDRTQTVNGTTENSSQVFELDARQNRLLVTDNSASGTYVLYDSSEGRYAKYTAGNQTEYRVQQTGSFSPYTATDVFGTRMVAFNYAYVNTTTFDGDTVARYDVTGISSASGANASDYTVEGYVYVDEDGVVRKLLTDITNKPAGATIREEYSVVKVGSTGLNEPTWLSAAETAVENNSTTTATPEPESGTPTPTETNTPTDSDN